MGKSWVFGFVLAVLAFPVRAEIYTWTDAEGKVHYADKISAQQKNEASALPIDTEYPPPDDNECHSIRCRGERLEARKAEEAKREKEEQELLAKQPAAPERPRHSAQQQDERRFLRSGMSEGEVIVRVGEPDLVTSEGTKEITRQTETITGKLDTASGDIATVKGTHRVKIYNEIKAFYYYPTPLDPLTTTKVTLVNGVVTAVERTLYRP
ncbi:MAG: DUF4124 domain-containing protein [Burkholderiales bacterium]